MSVVLSLGPGVTGVPCLAVRKHSDSQTSLCIKTTQGVLSSDLLDWGEAQESELLNPFQGNSDSGGPR